MLHERSHLHLAYQICYAGRRREGALADKIRPGKGLMLIQPKSTAFTHSNTPNARSQTTSTIPRRALALTSPSPVGPSLDPKKNMPPPAAFLLFQAALTLLIGPANAYQLPHQPPRHNRKDALQRTTGAAAAAAAAFFGPSIIIPQPSAAVDMAEAGSQAPPPPVPTQPQSKLLQKFLTTDLTSPGLSGFGGAKVLFLPPFLFGTWNATLCLKSIELPLGERFVPPQVLRSLNAVEIEKPTSFLLRFYSTLPDTTENTLRVTLGEVPKSEVVPDRVYNTRSVLDAFYGYPAVGEIDYDLAKNPLRMDVAFATMGPDMRPLPSRRQQLLFNNLQSERVRPDDLFVCSEYVRTVTVGPGRRVTVTDSETLSQYELVEEGRIEGKQRVALYLTPNPNTAEGALFFETNNKVRVPSLPPFPFIFLVIILPLFPPCLSLFLFLLLSSFLWTNVPPPPPSLHPSPPLSLRPLQYLTTRS